MNLKPLKDQAETHLLETFGIAPEKTKIRLYKAPEWRRFRSKWGFQKEVLGAHFSTDLSSPITEDSTAHILEDSEFLPLTFFHEYFGHGLWTEHTPYGQEKKRLEKKIREEESNAKITENNRISFWKSNENYKALLELHKTTMPQNEGFAMWMEHYLASMTGNKELFLKLFAIMPDKRKELCMRFIAHQHTFGEHALLYECGFPKHYDTNILEGILRKLFKEDFNSIEFAMVYGSRKPHSDIDIFMVSDKIPNNYSEWIDISSITHQKFQELLSKMDLSITDPLFTGQFICGNKAYLEQAKTTINKMPITQENIEHQILHSEQARHIALANDGDLEKYQTAMRWKDSYFANAKEMKQNNKPLTLANLATKYPEILRKN